MPDRSDIDFQSAAQCLIILVFIFALAAHFKSSVLEEMRGISSETFSQTLAEKEQQVKDLETRNLFLVLETSELKKQLEEEQVKIPEVVTQRNKPSRNFVKIFKGAVRPLLKNSLAGGNSNDGDSKR